MPHLKKIISSLLKEAIHTAFPLSKTPKIHISNQIIDSLLKGEQLSSSNCKYRTHLPETIFSLFYTQQFACFGLPSSREVAHDICVQMPKSEFIIGMQVTKDCKEPFILVAEIAGEEDDEEFEKSATVIDIFIDPTKICFSQEDTCLYPAQDQKLIYVENFDKDGLRDEKRILAGKFLHALHPQSEIIKVHKIQESYQRHPHFYFISHPYFDFFRRKLPENCEIIPVGDCIIDIQSKFINDENQLRNYLMNDDSSLRESFKIGACPSSRLSFANIDSSIMNFMKVMVPQMLEQYKKEGYDYQILTRYFRLMEGYSCEAQEFITSLLRRVGHQKELHSPLL